MDWRFLFPFDLSRVFLLGSSLLVFHSLPGPPFEGNSCKWLLSRMARAAGFSVSSNSFRSTPAMGEISICFTSLPATNVVSMK